MNTKYLRSLTLASLLGVALAGSIGTSLAFAEDLTVGVETEVNATPGAVPKGPSGPLKKMREKAMDVKNSIKMEKQEFREEKKNLIQKRVEMNTGIKEERKGFRKETIDERKTMHADVKAQLDAATTTQEKRAILKGARENRASFRAEVKTHAAVMREGFRAQRSDLRAEVREVIADRFTSIMQRLVNALERFDQILARVDSRIEKLRADGVDVSAAVAASVSANASVDSATAAVGTAQAAIAAAAASETPRDQIDEVRSAVRAAVDGVKAAQQAIKEAFRVLKGLAVPETSASLESSGSVDVSN